MRMEVGFENLKVTMGTPSRCVATREQHRDALCLMGIKCL